MAAAGLECAATGIISEKLSDFFEIFKCGNVCVSAYISVREGRKNNKKLSADTLYKAAVSSGYYPQGNNRKKRRFLAY